MPSNNASKTPEPADSGPGLRRLREIYAAGARGRRPVVPTDAETLERRAHRVMSRRAWAYVAGGAGSGSDYSY